jgi:hypothetical protein
VIGAFGVDNAARLGPTRPLVHPAPVKGVGQALAAVVAQGFGLDVEQVSSILAASGQPPIGVPAQVTEPSAGQVLGKLSATDFTAGRLGLLTQVQGLIATANKLGTRTTKEPS